MAPSKRPNNVAFHHHVLDLQVPVSVVLAKKTMPLHQVLQLVPGAMIQFEQPCDEPLTLQVVGKSIGNGTAVKVGDKFGLKVNEIRKTADKS